jgi:hypothetical protein
MVSREIVRHCQILWWVIVLALMLVLADTSPVKADSHSQSSTIQELQALGRSKVRPTSEPVQLANSELGGNFKLAVHSSEQSPLYSRLLKLSQRLREIARGLGTSRPVIVPVVAVPLNPSQGVQEVSYRITDFRTSEGQWRSLTVGYALAFVTQELDRLNGASTEVVSLDFLAQEVDADLYHPLLDVSLSWYCQKLLTLLED